MILPLIFFLILGTAVGSFLNVVAYRSIHSGSVFSGRSYCPHCKHKLKAADLVPIVSYLFLKGKCRYCSKEISLQYPAVELVTGLAFSFIFFHWWQGLIGVMYHVSGVTFLDYLALIYLLFVVSALIVLTTTDIVDGLLPNTIIVPSVAFAGLYKLFLLLIGVSNLPTLSADLISALLASLVFFAIVNDGKLFGILAIDQALLQ